MSEGIQKVLALKKQVDRTTKATAASARQYRRVTSNFQLEKDAFNSNEIRTSQQMADMRHGTRRSTGVLNGELVGSAYDELIAATLRRDFSAGATTGAVITIAADVNEFTRSAGSFITDGFNVGTVVSVSGFTTSGNNGLFAITSVAALTLGVLPLNEQVMAAEVEGDSVTIVESGQKTFTPLTGQTRDYFTGEEWQPDITVSRTHIGLQVDTMNIGIQPNAMCTIDFGLLGYNSETPTASQYFTSPTAVGGEGVYAGQDGALVIDGVANVKVTGLNLAFTASIQQVPVIGSNLTGATSRGKMQLTIDGTAIFDDDSILGYFDEETEISLHYVLFNADRSDFFSIFLPRVKIGSATANDGEIVQILSFSGVVLEYVGAVSGVEKTTALVQDSTLA